MSGTQLCGSFVKRVYCYAKKQDGRGLGWWRGMVHQSPMSMSRNAINCATDAALLPFSSSINPSVHRGVPAPSPPSPVAPRAGGRRRLLWGLLLRAGHQLRLRCGVLPGLRSQRHHRETGPETGLEERTHVTHHNHTRHGCMHAHTHAHTDIHIHTHTYIT